MIGLTNFEKEQYRLYLDGLDATTLLNLFAQLGYEAKLEKADEATKDKAHLVDEEVIKRMTRGGSVL